MLALSVFIFSSCFLQPPNKKAASVKSGVSKKGDGGGQSKSSKVVEPEDIEVNS